MSTNHLKSLDRLIETVKRVRAVRFEKGRAEEERVKALLEKAGFIVFLHPHSATPDILAYKHGMLYLIEVKYTSGDKVVLFPDQVECITSMLSFFREFMPANAFAVAYFSSWGEYGVKRISINDRYVIVRRGDYDPDLPL